MIVKRDTKTISFFLICLLVLLPLLPVVNSANVVLGNEIEENETNSISIQSNNPDGLDITIVQPESGASFNVNEMLVSGTTTIANDAIDGNIIVQLFHNGRGISFAEAEIIDGAWETNLDMTPYTDGTYMIQAKAIISQQREVYSNVVEFSVERKPLEVTISKPTSDYTNTALVAGQTLENLPVKLVIGDKTFETVSDEDGYFSFDLNNEIGEGEHTFKVSVESSSGEKVEVEKTFILYKTRPFISTELFPKSKATQVDLNSSIKVKIISGLTIEKDDLIADPILVFEDGNDQALKGTMTYNQSTMEITFTPGTGLKPYTKYHVFVNPLLQDKAGNFIHARNWSFTTTGAQVIDNPHGNYLSNTNTCITCHGAHMTQQPKLLQASGELEERVSGSEAESGYCLACHDGTAANMPSNLNGHSNHNAQLVAADGTIESLSCGSCHDPHLSGHDKNQHLFKDRYVFNHQGMEGVTPFIADSSQQLCETCHGYDTFNIKLDERVQYEVFAYRDWNTSAAMLGDGKDSFGSKDDYSLCLSCHNASYSKNYKNVVNIEKYYANPSSGHFISADRVKDGSLLDGHMPCADCHDTHGSENASLIKSELGHNNESSFVQTGNWSGADERRFCTSCHNNSTELYGITVSYNANLQAHRHTQDLSCVTCHGGPDASFIEAVHSPE